MATLSIHDQNRIDAVIEDVKLRTGLLNPNKNLLKLAEREGISVLISDLRSIRSGLSGILTYADDKLKTDPRIYIDSSMPENRKTFTLAHELGHHFLHKGMKQRLDKIDYSKADTKDETEANYFAASLLVPKRNLLAEVSKSDDLKAVASYFNVSPAVIENRLQWISSN